MRRPVVVTGLVVGGIALLVVLFFVFRSGADEEEAKPETTTAAATTEAATTEAATTEAATTEATVEEPPPPPPGRLVINVVDGRPDGGIQHLTVDEGEQVTVRVTSDGVEDEVHVHGYDLSQDVAPGAPANISFEATITGRFEIELEDAGTPIGELEVR